MQAGCVGTGAEEECGGDIAGVNGAEGFGRDPAEPAADRFAGPRIVAVADEEGGPGDCHGAERESAQLVLEFALDPIVEDAGISPCADGADEEEVSGPTVDGEPGDCERILEVHAAESGLRTGGADCRSEGAEDVIDVKDIGVLVEAIEIGDGEANTIGQWGPGGWRTNERAHLGNGLFAREKVETFPADEAGRAGDQNGSGRHGSRSNGGN